MYDFVPYIALTCPDLSKLTYGIVKVTGNRLGSKALYKCNYGYKLVGKYLRSCLNTGKWSDKAPICKRMDSNLIFIESLNPLSN